MTHQAAPAKTLAAAPEPAYTIQYGTTQIRYALHFTRRKTLGITVHPDCTVTVTAPFNSTPELIAEKVKQRSAWIVKQQRKLERYLPPPARRYVSGEIHLDLGKRTGFKSWQRPAYSEAPCGRLRIFTVGPIN